MLQPDLGKFLVLCDRSRDAFLGRINIKFVFGSIAALMFHFLFYGTLFFYPIKSRLTTFINPYNDPLGDGYHVIQSMLAVGQDKFQEGAIK